MRIVSGGQTGADRAALDAALEAGVPCGGWCPAGRRAEDGVIPERYPVSELPRAGYARRTRQNVLDSDATLIVSFGPPENGSALTLRRCQQASKPHLVIDANAGTVESAAADVLAFLRRSHPKTLNVAGPRASRQPEIYGYVRKLMRIVLSKAVEGPLFSGTACGAWTAGIAPNEGAVRAS